MKKQQLMLKLPAIRLKLQRALGYKTSTLRYARKGGSRGVAFRIQDGNVLKVTTDASEAKASSKLINKHIPDVAEIYRVFTLKSEPGVYFILQERLIPLDPDDEDLIDQMDIQGTHAYEHTMKLVAQYHFRSIDDFRDFYELELKLDDDDVEELLEFVSEHIELLANTSDALRGFLAKYITENFPENAIPIMDHADLAMEVLESLGSLVKYHIDFDDTIGANLMQTQSGDLKWIDLGYKTKAPGQPAVEKLESTLKRRRYRD